jgi:hypothetical protein
MKVKFSYHAIDRMRVRANKRILTNELVDISEYIEVRAYIHNYYKCLVSNFIYIDTSGPVVLVVDKHAKAVLTAMTDGPAVDDAKVLLEQML